MYLEQILVILIVTLLKNSHKRTKERLENKTIQSYLQRMDGTSRETERSAM